MSSPQINPLATVLLIRISVVRWSRPTDNTAAIWCAATRACAASMSRASTPRATAAGWRAATRACAASTSQASTPQAPPPAPLPRSRPSDNTDSNKKHLALTVLATLILYKFETVYVTQTYQYNARDV